MQSLSLDRTQSNIRWFSSVSLHNDFTYSLYIPTKPSCSSCYLRLTANLITFYNSVYIYTAVVWIYKKFKIHAIPVNYTSRTVQPSSGRKNAFVICTNERLVFVSNKQFFYTQQQKLYCKSDDQPIFFFFYEFFFSLWSSLRFEVEFLTGPLWIGGTRSDFVWLPRMGHWCDVHL